MRSRKIKIGVACAAAAGLALMVASWATGARTAASAPVGSGTASATRLHSWPGVAAEPMVGTVSQFRTLGS